MWFGNRVAEIQDHMADWTRQGITVEELHHWPGTDNIADLATKGKATVRDIKAGSDWQQGPAALRLEQDQWPASRDFVRKISDKERSKNYASHATCGIRQPNLCTMMTTLKHEESRPETKPGGPCDVSTSAPASTSTCATTNASVHALADDPGVTDERREQPQLGSAEGPGQPKELQQGPPTS